MSIETGNHVVISGQPKTAYQVCDVIQTQIAEYAVLQDAQGLAVDMVRTEDLKQVNVRKIQVEMWVVE